MLTLPIKKKWFDMILSGEKLEEYRDMTPYYKTRFKNVFEMYPYSFIPDETDKQKIVFRNGYSLASPSFVAICSLSVGTGKPEWGAEPGKEYYKLQIHEIVRKDGVYECKSGYILR